MADKDFVVRNGLVVNNNVIYAANGRVGINNNNPTSSLHVTGSGFFSGNLNVNGILTFANTTSLNGAVFIANSLTTSGFANIGGSLTVASSTTLNGNLAVVGNTTLNGNLNGNNASFANVYSPVASFGNSSFTNISVSSNTTTANLTVNNISTFSGTATFNSTVVAGFTPTATNHVVNKAYADAASIDKMPLGGGTFTGNFAMATTFPTIEFNDTNAATFWIHCNDNLWGVVRPAGVNNKTWTGWAFNTDTAGNFNITSALNVGTTIYAGGNITGFSDERLKKEIQTIKDSLEMVKKLRGVFFKFKETDKPGVGVIAQEVKEVLPQVVEQTDDGTLSVAYGNIVGVLIEAIKELSDKVESLEKKLER